MAGAEEEFYVSYFQEPGRAEAEIEPDVRGWLAGFYAALSADTMPAPDAPSPYFVPRGGRMRDRFPAGRLPGWLDENMDRDWEDLADHDGAPVTQPSLFVAGRLDASTTWLADAIDAHATTLPGLVSSHLLDGCGHWIQQERPAEFNRLLTKWLAALPD
jgi:pimeloyl-ACP methyl ester carboxylesterase